MWDQSRLSYKYGNTVYSSYKGPFTDYVIKKGEGSTKTLFMITGEEVRSKYNHITGMGF